MIDRTLDEQVQAMRAAGMKPITLVDGTAGAARRMQRAWAEEKRAGRDPAQLHFVPSNISVERVKAAREKRARKATKQALLAARQVLPVIAFLCWATDRAMVVNIKRVEK